MASEVRNTINTTTNKNTSRLARPDTESKIFGKTFFPNTSMNKMTHTDFKILMPSVVTMKPNDMPTDDSSDISAGRTIMTGRTEMS